VKLRCVRSLSAMTPAAAASAALAGDSVGAGQRLRLCQKLGSITVNTFAGSVTNLSPAALPGSLPDQSFTGAYPAGTFPVVISPDGQYLLSADYRRSTVSRYGHLPRQAVLHDHQQRAGHDSTKKVRELDLCG